MGVSLFKDFSGDPPNFIGIVGFGVDLVCLIVVIHFIPLSLHNMHKIVSWEVFILFDFYLITGKIHEKILKCFILACYTGT